MPNETIEVEVQYVEADEDELRDQMLKKAKHILSAKTDGNLSYWECHLSKEKVADLKTKIEKLVNERKEWESILYKGIARNMNIHFPSGDKFLPHHLRNMEMVLIGFSDKFKEISNLDTVPDQQTITEAIGKK